jgi:hypothetical protein
MKKYLLIIIFFSAFFVKSNLVEATHLLGSELTYTCTNTPGVYLIKLNLYQTCAYSDAICNGCPGNLNTNCSVSINVSGAGNNYFPQVPNTIFSGNNFGSISLSLKGKVQNLDSVQYCNAIKSTCTNCGTRTAGTFGGGVELYQFEGYFDSNILPSGVCYIQLAHSACCRTSDYTTIYTAGLNNPSLVQIQPIIINRCNSTCNNAPKTPNISNYYVCSGIEQSFSFFGDDSENDSIIYKLGNPIGSSIIPFNSPFTTNKPVQYLGFPADYPAAAAPFGIHLNPVTGVLRFTPIGNFVTPLIIELQEYERGANPAKLLGITRKEMKLVSNICNYNNAPRIVKYNACSTPEFSMIDTAYVSFANCKTFAARDFDLLDTTLFDIDTSQIIIQSGAMVKPLYNKNTRTLNGPRFDSIQFCWTPTDSLIRNEPYVLKLLAKDNHCPNVSKAIMGYQVFVKKMPNFSLNITQQAIDFQTRKFKYILSNGFKANQIVWQVETLPNSGLFTSIYSDSIAAHVFPLNGAYRVKLTASFNCNSAQVEQLVFIKHAGVRILARSNVLCKGDSSAFLGFTYANGQAPFQFSFNGKPFSNVDSYAHLPAGLYTIIGRDFNNVYDTIYVEITQFNNAISFQATQKKLPTCYNHSDGELELSALSGTPPFMYSIGSGPFQTSGLFSQLAAGNYAFSIKDSTGCTSTQLVHVLSPEPMQLSHQILSEVVCAGGITGSFKTNVVGGIKPYTFSFNNGAFSTNSQFDNLASAMYSISVKDSLGCMVHDSVSMALKSLLKLALTKTNPTCPGANNGSISVLVFGGSPPYSYQWNNTVALNTPNIYGLGSAWYSVKIMDSNFCSAIDSVLIDNYPTHREEILYVSIDTSDQKPIIKWNSTAMKQIKTYYVLSRHLPDSFVTIDSLPFSNVSVIKDNRIATGNPKRQYQLMTLDSCQQLTRSAQIHQPVFIEKTAGNFVRILRSNYIGKLGGDYKLFRRILPGSWVLIATQTESQTLFIDSIVSAGMAQYLVQYTADFGVSDPVYSNILSLTATGLPSTKKIPHITVFPNPTTGSFLIQKYDLQNAITSYQLIDMKGKAIKYWKADRLKEEEQISIENQALGVYILQILFDSGNIEHIKIELVK